MSEWVRFSQSRALKGLCVLLATAVIATLTNFDSKSGRPQRLSALAAPLYATAPTIVLVDPRVTKRTIPRTFFGINYTALWDDAQGSRASARALAQTPIKVVRFPGGAPADLYDWQQPFYQHQSTTNLTKVWRWTRSLGAQNVLFQTNYLGNLPNPPGKPYAVNSPQNAAAWVTYNKVHKIAASMEVGNEEDMYFLKSKDDARYASYIAGFNAQAKAMHRANSHVRVLGPVGTNEWFWRNLDGLGMFLRGTGNRTGTSQVDGVSLHFYATGNWNDAMGEAQYWLSPQGPWAAIKQTIRANDTRNLPVYITEWNLGNTDHGNAFNPTLGHALAVTDMIGAFAQSGVAGQDYFVVHRSDGWGLFYGTKDARPTDTPTPTYYSMALWGHMGTRVVASKQNSDPASVMSTYTTTKRDGSLQVLVINKRPSTRTVKVELQRATPAGHRLSVYSLSSAGHGVGDLDARFNGVKMPSPGRRLPAPQNMGIVRGRTVSYAVPGYSAVVLNIDGMTKAQQVKWKDPGSPRPIPALNVEVKGSVSKATVKAGETEQLTTVARSNDTIDHAIVDLEVYDSLGTKVFQGTQSAKLMANTPITVTKAYATAGGAWSGQYHFKVGIFGSGWQPLYSWKDDAGSFDVEGVPWPQVSATGQVDHNLLKNGDTANFTSAVSVKGGSLSKVIVDFEVYDGSGARVWQGTQVGVSIPKDGDTSVVQHWKVPSTLPAGSYTLKMGIFQGPAWKPMYVWNDRAVTFSIGS